jgi:hypothetical protein
VIVFHILDEAEVNFPFDGLVQLYDPESGEQVEVDASGYQQDYEAELEAFRGRLQRESFQAGNRLRTGRHQHAV